MSHAAGYAASADVEAAQALGLLGLDVERARPARGPARRGRSRPARRRRPAGPRRPPRPSRRRSCAPSRRRRGARASRRVLSRKNTPCTRPVARTRRRTGDSAIAGTVDPWRHRARSTLAAELEAAGGVDAPPTAAARLREVLAARAAPRPRRARQAALGLRRAGRGRASPPRTACCSPRRPPTPALRADPEAAGEREWLLVAATVATLVDLACPGPPADRGRPARCARARAPAACCSPIPAPVEPGRARGVRARRLRRARRGRSTACAPPPARSRPACSSAARPARADRRRAPAARRRGRGAAAAPELEGEQREEARAGAARRRRRRRRAPARGPRSRPAASPAGSSSGSTAWASGAATTRTSPTSRAASRATSARSRRTSARRCWTPGCWPRSRPSASATCSSTRAARGDIRALHRARRRATGAATARTLIGCAPCRSPGRSPRTVKTKLADPRHARPRRGHRPPVAAGPAAQTRRRARRAGARRPPPATRSPPRATRTRSAIVDELGTLTFREIHERTNALAHALREDGHRPGRRRRDHVPQPPRLHRDRRRVLEARRQRAVPQHGVLQAAADRRARARGARRRSSTTRSSPSCSATPTSSSSATSPGTSPTRSPATTRLEDLDRGRRHVRTSAPPKEPGKATILTSGTTGTPKGANRSQPKSMDPIAALLDRIPLKARETTMIAAPLFHSWGFAHWSLGISPRLDDRAQAQVRPRGDAVADRPAPGDRARRGAGDAPAHPRARRRGARALRPVGAVRAVPVVRLRAARLAVGPLDGPVRRQPLQPLRLDRGRVGDDRHAEGPARGARHRRQAAARHRREALRRRRQAGRAGGDGPHLRRQRDAVRGLHGRRQQGRHRRA